MTMNSILQNKEDGVCFLCGRRGTSADPLDEHHVFGGPYRKKSEKYGLKVFLHHSSCHIFGKEAVHNDAENDRSIKEHAQYYAMRKYGWTKDEWIALFGRNYRRDI